MVALSAKKAKSSKGSSFNAHALAYLVLGEKPAHIFPFSGKIRENLLRANIKVNHVIYVSSMFFWSLVVFVTFFVLTFVYSGVLLPALNMSIPMLSSVGYSLIVGVLAAGVTFATFMYYLNYALSSQKVKIDKNLVYITNYMAILASAGATPGETFNSLIGAGRVFGFQESARSIVKNIELLGKDIITAIDEESKRTPSKDYSDFLQGYIATIQTGGDMQAYLLAMSKKFLESRQRLLRKMINQLGLAGEIYVGILIAFPLLMVMLLSITGFFGGEVIAGLSATQVMPMMIYLLVPLMAVGVIIYLDSTMSSW